MVPARKRPTLGTQRAGTLAPDRATEASKPNEGAGSEVATGVLRGVAMGDPTSESLNTGVAATKVFNIPELLENILGRVFQIDIFILQRVSRTFNGTIQGSKMLQRKMLASTEREPIIESEFIDELVLSRFVDDNGPGYFQIEPFSGPYLDDRRMGVERKTLHCYLVDDKGQPMGWQGKRAVYTTGSWEKLTLGLPACSVMVSAYGAKDKVVGNFPASSTVSDLFVFLKTCRAEAAAKAARHHENQEKRKKAFAAEVYVARGLR